MKRFLSGFLALCLLLSMAACAGLSPSTHETAASAGSFPVTVTDQGGRTVTIAREPQRIVTCYYITTSALMALGLSGRVAGIETDPQKRPIYALSAPELLELPSVGNAKELDLEGALALEPDLVVLPLRQKEMAQRLEELGVSVVLVNPESHDLLLEMLTLLARATGTEAQGEALTAFISAQAEKLSSLSGEQPTVYLGGNSNLLTTAGDQMYQSGVIRMAGGINAAAALEDTYWAEISYEQLLAWDPEYIVLASDAAYSVEDVYADPNLANCRAVKQGNVVHLPNDLECWDSPVPGGILGAVWLASILHGDQITMDDAAEVIASFYEQFYGISNAEIKA